MNPLEHPAVAAFDQRVEAWADRWRGRPEVDRFFYGLSAAADHGMAWHAIGVGRALRGTDTWRGAIELSAGLGVEAALVNGPMKWLFRRARPTADQPRPHHLRSPRTSSFPSGHASAGMFAALVLSRRGRHRWMWFVLGGLVGWSRVHVRIHHPSDVVGGTVAGLGLGLAARRLFERLDARSVRSTT